jgi:uncharacterized protein involved in exopolysaccharide biosynthesis
MKLIKKNFMQIEKDKKLRQQILDQLKQKHLKEKKEEFEVLKKRIDELEKEIKALS